MSDIVVYENGEIELKVSSLKDTIWASTNFAHTSKHGSISDKTQTRDIKYYNLDIVLADLIRGAKSSIILIDNYCDDSVLTLFSKNQNIDIRIYTHTISKQLKLDLDKYNSQYRKITIKNFKDSHDSFMIIDNTNVYHIGASLKDLGKKWFAFSKIGLDANDMLDKLK